MGLDPHEMGMNGDPNVAIVTGSSRGIGQAIAIALARRGAKIALNYRSDESAAQGSLTEIRAFSDAIAIKADVSREEEVLALVSDTIAKFGRVDILVNNAGITSPAKLTDMDFESWDKVLRTNLNSCFLCSKAVLPTMQSHKWGRIINISSVYGLAGSYGQTNYCAAKAGVIGFTKALALETAKSGITVNAIAPGLIATDMVSATSSKITSAIIAQTPMGRMGTPGEIGSMAAYLASEEASYLTGQVIGVNGGLHM